MLPEPFGVLPGSDFVEWASVREDNKSIKLFSRRKMLGLAIAPIRHGRQGGSGYSEQAETACLG